MSAANEHPGPNSGSRSTGLGTIFLTVFIDLVGFSIIFPLYPAMLEHYLALEGEGSVIASINDFFRSLIDASGPRADFLTMVLFGGALGSLYSLLQFVCAPIWGRLSDIHGRRRILLFSVSGTALGYFLWIISGSFVVLLLSRVICGIMGGNISVATAAIADVTDEKSRSKGMALIGVAFGLGFILGPAIGGLTSLIDLTGGETNPGAFAINPFSAPALFAFIFSVANLIWIATSFRETLPAERRGIISEEQRAKGKLTGILSLESKPIRSCILTYFVFIFAFSGMEFTLTFLATDRFSYTPTSMAWIFVFVGVVMIVIQGGIVRRFASKVGEKRMAFAGIALGVLAFVALGLANSQITFYLALGLMAAGVGLASPTLSSLTSLLSDDSNQGRNLGYFRSAGSFARAIGPILAGCSYWYFGSTLTYLIAAIVLIIPLVTLYVIRQPAPSSN